jgi:DNA-binding transcriptional regulator YiaG
MDVNEAAAMLGISPRRVRALISKGQVRARKDGTRWVIDAVPPKRRKRRPLSLRSRTQLAQALRSWSLAGLEQHDRSRTAERLRALTTSDDPGSLLLDWWGGMVEADNAYVRSLLERARAGDADGVRETLSWRRTAYLATTDLLAGRVSIERLMRGLTTAHLASLANVSVETLRAIERGVPQATPGASLRVLRALDVEPVALPPLAVNA